MVAMISASDLPKTERTLRPSGICYVLYMLIDNSGGLPLRTLQSCRPAYMSDSVPATSLMKLLRSGAVGRDPYVAPNETGSSWFYRLIDIDKVPPFVQEFVPHTSTHTRAKVPCRVPPPPEVQLPQAVAVVVPAIKRPKILLELTIEGESRILNQEEAKQLYDQLHSFFAPQASSGL